jgi:hypothetical protein
MALLELGHLIVSFFFDSVLWKFEIPSRKIVRNHKCFILYLIIVALSVARRHIFKLKYDYSGS